MINNESINKKNNEVKGARLFFGYIGLFLIMIGLIILTPLIVIIGFPHESDQFHLFLGPGLIAIILGFALFLLIRKKRKARLEKWQSYLLLITVWVISILFASLPFMITDEFNFTQAIFEATSGFTTTATSLMTQESLESCTHVFLFYRVWLLFVGGIGLTLILTSAISDSNGLSIYNLEGHNDRLLPNLIKSARIIFLIYTIFIIIGVICYCACGMNVFEAVCNSISSLSTGGFTIKPGGIGAYNSRPIEIVTIVLMLLGSTNFMIHFAILRGKFKNLFYHCEFYSYIILFILFIPPLAAGYTQYFNDVGTGIRRAIFNFVSTTTSSGFILGDTHTLYWNLPSYMAVILLFCMIIGGQAGSTSGGIKQMRLVQISKQIYWQIRSLIDSPHIVPSHTIIRYGKKEAVSQKEFYGSSVYLFIYIAVILFGTFLLTCCGYDFVDSIFEFTSMLSTTGYSFGIMCYTAPTGVLWIGILAMFIGRLEPLIFIMLIARGLKSARTNIKYKIIDKQLKKS